jgi:hypothetical protein
VSRLVPLYIPFHGRNYAGELRGTGREISILIGQDGNPLACHDVASFG